jgi:mannonate dehydratase
MVSPERTARLTHAGRPASPDGDKFAGQARIMHTNAALLRATELVPSRANAVCYCVGSLHPAGEDVIAGIEALGDKIAFVHARNVRGTAADFVETWHDDGEIDMPEVIRALKSLSFYRIM